MEKQSVEISPEKLRSPREAMELKDRLHFVAKSLSGNFNMRLIPGDNWAAGLSEKYQKERQKYPEKSLEEFDQKLLIPEIMMYPEKDLLEKNEDYIWGVFRHEMGHIKHSDYQSLLESQDWAKKEGYSPSDLFFIYDAWEDGRSNNMEGQTSKTAKQRLGAYLKEDISDTLLLDIEKRSLPVQYGAICWAMGAEPFIDGFDFNEIVSKIKDERVLAAFEETKSVLRDYLDERIGRKAFSEILWEKGWPVFKELIDKQVEKDAKENFEKEKEKNTTNPEEKHGTWDDLTPEEKQPYKDQAREELTEEEKELIKMLQPKSAQIKEKEDGTFEMDERGVTGEDIWKGEKAEEETKKEKERMEEEINRLKNEAMQKSKESIQKLKERASGLTEEERTEYEKYFSEVKKYVNILVEKLDDIFPAEEDSKWEGDAIRGKRVDAKRIASEIPTGHGKMFETKTVPEIKQLAFTLLIDASGSMCGENIENAVKAAILMAEAFSKKGIPFEILAFHRKIIELKGFEDSYFGKKKLDILKVLKEVKTMDAGYNNDGYAMDTSARRLQKRLLMNDAQGALIVLSDGQPAASFEYSGIEWNLNTIVNKWSKQIPLIGVGIGPYMEETISRYYGKNGLSVPDVTKLPRELLRILEKQLSRFERK